MKLITKLNPATGDRVVIVTMKTKYRIVTDRYAGFECQVWRWWWPFWVQMSGRNGMIANTHGSIDAAKEFIKSRKNRVKIGDEVWRSE